MQTVLRLTAGILALLALFAASAPAQQQSESSDGSLSGASLEQLFEDASLWKVGENKRKVERARAELAERGREAVRYILDNELDTTETLNIRAIDSVLAKLESEQWLPQMLVEKWQSTDDPTVRWQLMRQFAKRNYQRGLDYAWRVIEQHNPDVQDREKVRLLEAAIGAVRNLAERNTAELEKLDGYLNGASDALAIAAAKAYAELGGEREVRRLVDHFGDMMMPRRRAFQDALKKLMQDRPELLREQIDTLEEKVRSNAGEGQKITLAALVETGAELGHVAKDRLVEFMRPPYPKRVSFAAVRGAVESGLMELKDLPADLGPRLLGYIRNLLSSRSDESQADSGN